MEDQALLTKLYDYYLDKDTIDFGTIPLNQNFLDNRMEVLSRPIASLEGFGRELNFNSFWLSVFLHLDRNIDYLCGEFHYSDDEFKKVVREFTKGWYYGEVFVAYGTRFINLEREAAERNTGQYDPCKLNKICRWRLYRRTRKPDGNYVFSSLISMVPDVKLDIDDLVRVSYEGMGVFIQWLELAKEYVSGMSAYLKLLQLSVTRFKITSMNNHAKDNALTNICGWNTFFEGNTDVREDSDVEPQELVYPEHPQMFLDTLLNYYAEGCRRMGFVFGSESKSERLTSGEHYRALKMTSNIQNYFLSIMQAFTRDMRLKFPEAPSLEITLAYDVTGQGIPDNNKAVKDKWRYDGDKENTSIRDGQKS